MLALWEGENRGGTYHTISYANKKNKDVINIWYEFERKNNEENSFGFSD